MATVPTDPNPDSPADTPAEVPDEIVPPDGDTDIPAPIDDPHTSGAIDAGVLVRGNIEGDPALAR